MAKEPFFPEEVTGGAVKVSLTGQSRVCVEQHRGLVGYTPQEVLLRTKAGILRIAGENLSFLRYSSQDAILTGRIESIRIERIRTESIRTESKRTETRDRGASGGRA